MTKLHPFVSLIFFAAVIAQTIAFTHPVFVGILLLGAFCTSAFFKKLSGRFLLVLAGILLFLPLLYACFENFGVTPLGFTVFSNTVTAEALIKGLLTAAKTDGILLWMSGFFAVFTREKILYLYGKISPKAAVFLAIFFRIIPETEQKMRDMKEAGEGIGKGGLMSFPARFSALLTWLSDALLKTSASMKCRGSSLSFRTSYALYFMGKRDFTALFSFSLTGSVLIAGMLLDEMTAFYRPAFYFCPMTAFSFVCCAAEGIFILSYLVCSLPPFTEKEDG